MQLAAGTILNNKYKILRILGRGGFGITYEAEQEPIQLRVCIKELDSSGIKEGQILGSVSSDSIVRVLDYFEENNKSYLVMEYLDGITLAAYIDKYGTLSPICLFSSIKPLLSALSRLHKQGLIHRDIAPDNIMVLLDEAPAYESSLKLKLFDFGTARSLGLSKYTCTLKDGYTPIEQMAADEVQGPYTDIYALSAAMYFCLTGKPPEGAYSRLLDDGLKRPSQLGIAVNSELEEILMKGLALQPSDRYQAADEMLSAIEAVLPSESSSKQSIPEAKTKSKRPVIALCTAIAAVLVFVMIFFKFTGSSMTYNPETMYKVTLTPTDEFTVSGYNESIKTLEERLKLFASGSGSYSLTENKGIITLLLNKKDFPQNEAADTAYGTTVVEYDSVPEYVLRGYLTRASSLVLKASENNETIALNQTEDFSEVLTDVISTDAISSSEVSSGISADGTCIDVSFSKDFLDKNKETLGRWNNSYSLRSDIDCSPPVNTFSTIPKKDGSGFYLLTDDSESLINVLEYNLTHAPLEHSFNIEIEEQVSWQNDTDSFGKYQVSENTFSNDDTSLSYYVYGNMTDGELLDNFQVIRSRLDALKSPYALGEMDPLSAVTSGCDSPLYKFIAIKTNDANLSYTDVADLLLCSNKFILLSEDGSYSDNYITSCYQDGNSITVNDYSFAAGLTDKNAKVYIAYLNGFDQTAIMEGTLEENNKFCFSSFANGESASGTYSWLTDLIAACINTQPPATLNAYALDISDTAVSTGLFKDSFS